MGLPAVTPVTTPVVGFTVAMAEFDEDQVPLFTGCESDVFVPAQNTVVPVIVAGVLFIVSSRVVRHPMPDTE